MILTIILLIYTFIFIAVCDTIKFHWSTSTFSEIKIKKLNDWLNPNSYIWMYKDGDKTKGEYFWGSSRWFAFLIDGWHFFKMLQILCWILVLTSNIYYIPVISTTIDTLLIYVLYGLVFEFFYSFILIKNKK